MKHFLLALLLVGCSGTTYPRRLVLDQRFSPLAAVEEGSPPGLRPGMVATVGTTAYTLSMRAFLSAYAPGSVPFDALLFHEREHARSQAAQPLYFYWYATQPQGFRRAEEERGWAVELAYLKSHGQRVDVDACARILSENYDGMITYDDARAWVVEELAK